MLRSFRTSRDDKLKWLCKHIIFPLCASIFNFLWIATSCKQLSQWRVCVYCHCEEWNDEAIHKSQKELIFNFQFSIFSQPPLTKESKEKRASAPITKGDNVFILSLQETTHTVIARVSCNLWKSHYFGLIILQNFKK